MGSCLTEGSGGKHFGSCLVRSVNVCIRERLLVCVRLRAPYQQVVSQKWCRVQESAGVYW